MGDDARKTQDLEVLRQGHIRITKSLESQFEKSGFEVILNQEYVVAINNHLFHGELDIKSVDPYRKIIIAVEVKGIKNKTTSKKAYLQLSKDFFHLSSMHPNYHIVLMYAYRDEANKKGYAVKRCNQDKIKSILEDTLSP